MLRFKLLLNLFVISLGIAILMPVYQSLLVLPAYNKLQTTETEGDAVRYASYMVRTLGLENQFLTRDTLPENLGESLKPVSRDNRLVKLRIFSAQGEIIFSTKADEIGQINERTYFRQIVANGRVYSKVVQKDRETAEGAVTRLDVVETYVPFMVGQEFGGAIEVYYDITASMAEIEELSAQTTITTIIMSLVFLLAISIALYRAYVSFLEREAAEKALKLANEELEQRVDERTYELSSANEQLTEQIAERTLAQMALGGALEESKQDREKLDEILRSVPDGVVVADSSLNVLHMNTAAEEILNVSLEKVLGGSIEALSDEVDFQKKVSQRLNITHAARSFDFDLASEENQPPRSYQVRVSRFAPDEAVTPGIVLLIRDVTREREIERMKSAFLGMAAHELNTPLTTIIGYSELLTSEETASSFNVDQQEEYLHLIHNKALSLGGLIDDLLDLSRVESGRPLTLNYEEFSLDATVRQLVTTYREENSQHQFEVVLPDDPVRLCADQTRLGQVVEHLLSNAVKYSPDGGRILVTLTQNDEAYRLSVEDHGIGMNEEQIDHIFDRFYRADSSDTAVQGVGLGMCLVRNVVLAHYGDIQVDSEFGQGTTVVFSLPKMPPADSNAVSHPFSS